MPQKLTTLDLNREVRTTFARHDAGDATAVFCDDNHGWARCDRFKGHNGKHAAGVSIQKIGPHWGWQKVVRW